MHKNGFSTLRTPPADSLDGFSGFLNSTSKSCTTQILKHEVADALSWLAKNGEDTNPLEDDIMLLAIDAHT